MAGRNLLVRGMMLSHKESPHMKSPVNISPMTNFSLSLQRAKLSKGTPKRKLLLTSTSPSPVMKNLSPLQCFGQDKENFQSPDLPRPLKGRKLFTSPLRDIKNIKSRNLIFSPMQKMILSQTPPKKSTEDEKVKTKDINLSLSSPSTQTSMPRSKFIHSSTPVTSLTARTLSSLAMCNDDDIFDMKLLNEDGSNYEKQPKGFSTLLSAPIRCSASSQNKRKFLSRPQKHLPIRRCLSKMEVSSSPISSNDFKRPQPPTNLSQMMDSKRRKPECSSPLTEIPENTKATIPQNAKPKFCRSQSESQVSIMKAISRSVNVSEKLTGDFSRPVALPTSTSGKHPDLTSITHDTLVDLIKGRHSNKVNFFKILDCRYPYEYNGGHIKGAESWHTPQMVLDHLSTQKVTPVIAPENQKPDILIFHCEFSANRGPKAQRLLRKNDHTASMNYPALHHPEIYLLEDGYKMFYQKYPELCTPEGYTTMLDIKHSDHLKHFRAKSKSWACDNRKSNTKGPARRKL